MTSGKVLLLHIYTIVNIRQNKIIIGRHNLKDDITKKTVPLFNLGRFFFYLIMKKVWTLCAVF